MRGREEAAAGGQRPLAFPRFSLPSAPRRGSAPGCLAPVSFPRRPGTGDTRRRASARGRPGSSPASPALLTCHFVSGKGAGDRGGGSGETPGRPAPAPVSGTRGCAGKGRGDTSALPPACLLPSGRAAAALEGRQRGGPWRWVSAGLFHLLRALSHTKPQTHGVLHRFLTVCVCYGPDFINIGWFGCRS